MKKKIVTRYPATVDGVSFSDKMDDLFEWTENWTERTYSVHEYDGWHSYYNTTGRKVIGYILKGLEYPFAAAYAGLCCLIGNIRKKRSAKVQEEYTFVDGFKEGKYRSYHSNGKLEEKAFFHKGKKEGTAEEYYENGQLSRRCTYKNGILDGPYETYYETGQLKSKGFFRQGEFDGPYEEYFQDGQLFKKCVYKVKKNDHYAKNGPYEEYFENGQLRIKGTIRNGEWDGSYEEYYDNGQLFTNRTMKNGQPDGLETTYHRNGQVHTRCFWQDGLFDGPRQEYNEDGKLVRNEVYRDGEQLNGAEAETYLREWKKRRLENNPEWIGLTDKLAHLTDTIYYPEIKPARTPERQTKMKKMIEIRRGAELLGKAYKAAEEAGDEDLMEEIRKIARPFAKQEREQRQAFSRERVLKKIRSGRK